MHNPVSLLLSPLTNASAAKARHPSLETSRKSCDPTLGTPDQEDERRKAREKPDCLKAFDLSTPLHFQPWVDEDMQQGFTGKLPKLNSVHCQVCGERCFVDKPPTAAAGGLRSCARRGCDKKPVRAFSVANNMDLGAVPLELQGLIQAEEMLIA